MYLSYTDITALNEMRYELFRAKSGKVESGQLPPCQDWLCLHAVRANHQAAILQRALHGDPQTPSTQGFNFFIQTLDCGGWVLSENTEHIINWMSDEPAPVAILEFLSCKCNNCLSVVAWRTASYAPTPVF